jgi:very-short-patch-repair endonuclease
MIFRSGIILLTDTTANSSISTQQPNREGQPMKEKQNKQKYHNNLQQQANNLRKHATPAEKKLWQALREKQLGGYKFRWQHTIDKFIVDFCCLSEKLIIEIDAIVRSEKHDYDLPRNEDLDSQGYRVLRFSSKEVENQFDNVLEKIFKELNDF